MIQNSSEKQLPSTSKNNVMVEGSPAHAELYYRITALEMLTTTIVDNGITLKVSGL